MTAILLLRLEHNRFDDLLDLIEDQLDHADLPDRELLRNIVDYFSGYPERCHHPVEDLVYRKLRARNFVLASTVGDILQEHAETAELTRRFSKAVARMGDDTLTAELKDIMQRFVDHYREHMFAEEKYFFTVALDTLSESDWNEVEFALFDRNDPLFDREVEERFSHLRGKIEDLAKKSYRRGAFLQQAKQLRELTSIHSFNEAMQKAGHGYRLLEHIGGGYGLQSAGQFVVDIPKCSPARAVWCAYYYVEAATRRDLD